MTKLSHPYIKNAFAEVDDAEVFAWVEQGWIHQSKKSPKEAPKSNPKVARKNLPETEGNKTLGEPENGERFE